MAANVLDLTRNFVSLPLCPYPVSPVALVTSTLSLKLRWKDANHNPLWPQSFYAVPAAWALSIVPHFFAAGLGGKSFDNRSPRSFTSSLQSNQTLNAATKERIIRAEGAQQNGFENLGLFAAAVVAGNSTSATLSQGHTHAQNVLNETTLTGVDQSPRWTIGHSTP